MILTNFSTAQNRKSQQTSKPKKNINKRSCDQDLSYIKDVFINFNNAYFYSGTVSLERKSSKNCQLGTVTYLLRLCKFIIFLPAGFCLKEEALSKIELSPP